MGEGGKGKRGGTFNQIPWTSRNYILKIMCRYLHYLKNRRYSFNSDFQRGLRYPGLGTPAKADSLEKVVWKPLWLGKAS